MNVLIVTAGYFIFDARKQLNAFLAYLTEKTLSAKGHVLKSAPLHKTHRHPLQKRRVMHQSLSSFFVLVGLSTVCLPANDTNSSATKTVKKATITRTKANDPAYFGTILPKEFNTTIPFEWVGNLPLVYVEISGKKYKFLFDTAAPTMLPEALIQELRLSPIATNDKLHDSSGKEVKVALYRLPSLKVKDLEFKDFTILSSNFTKIFPLSCLGFDGVLGYNALQHMVVKLDLKDQKITFSDTLPPHEGFSPVDIKFEPRYGPLVNLNFAFGDAPFQLDTGNNANIQLGTTSVIPEMEKFKYPSRETRGAFVTGFGGAKQNNRKIEYLVKDFSIDNKIPIKTFPISVNQSGAFLIGVDFLKNFTTIIDFPGKKAYFKQIGTGEINKDFSKTFGFTPMWDGKSNLVVSAITTNTPAAKSDLKVGDKILSLNGGKMDAMTKEKFCKFMLSSQNNPNSFEKQRDLNLTIQHENMKPKEIRLSK